MCSARLLPVLGFLVCFAASAQTPIGQPPGEAQGVQQAPGKPLKTRPSNDPNAPALSPEQAAALRSRNVAIINGRPYQQPTRKDLFRDYLRDSYGLPAMARTTVRALYSEGRDKPSEWGTDFPGFMQRFGANAGTTAVTGNVRYAMELTFHEDLRYFPCHGCKVKAKIENALLAEITARHASDGHRFFTLTPTVADFSGPLVAHCLWYPGGVNPDAGVVSARLVFATRIGSHLFREFVLERRHTDRQAEQ